MSLEVSLLIKVDLDFNFNEIKRVIDILLKEENKQLGEIEIIIVDQEKLLEINQQYLNHNYHTDIITFDSSFLKTVSGELFLSLDYIKSSASELNISLNKELYRIMIHGVLHLCGYKDKSFSEKTLMTEKEDHYLNYFSEW